MAFQSKNTHIDDVLGGSYAPLGGVFHPYMVGTLDQDDQPTDPQFETYAVNIATLHRYLRPITDQLTKISAEMSNTSRICIPADQTVQNGKLYYAINIHIKNNRKPSLITKSFPKDLKNVDGFNNKIWVIGTSSERSITPWLNTPEAISTTVPLAKAKYTSSFHETITGRAIDCLDPADTSFWQVNDEGENSNDASCCGTPADSHYICFSIPNLWIDSISIDGVGGYLPRTVRIDNGSDTLSDKVKWADLVVSNPKMGDIPDHTVTSEPHIDSFLSSVIKLGSSFTRLHIYIHKGVGAIKLGNASVYPPTRIYNVKFYNNTQRTTPSDVTHNMENGTVNITWQPEDIRAPTHILSSTHIGLASIRAKPILYQRGVSVGLSIQLKIEWQAQAEVEEEDKDRIKLKGGFMLDPDVARYPCNFHTAEP